MRVSVCVGNYATTPYEITGIGQAVYCVEELCFAMKENAYLLDATLMSDVLVDWIADECGLRELSRELYPLVHTKGSLSLFVPMIQENVGFYAPEVIRDVEEVLKKGIRLTNIEKRKSQIDYLVQKKKYVAALRGYGVLLEQWKQWEAEGRELPAGKVKADILHNKGVALSRLMLFSQAAECFLEAYEIQAEEQYFLAYLSAKRMELSEEEYIAFAAGLPEAYEATLSLERSLEQLRKDFEEQQEFLVIQRRRELRESNRKQQYYDDNESLLQVLEESYRNSVSE